MSGPLLSVVSYLASFLLDAKNAVIRYVPNFKIMELKMLLILFLARQRPWNWINPIVRYLMAFWRQDEGAVVRYFLRVNIRGEIYHMELVLRNPTMNEMQA
jgi:hypothetical protein